MKETEEHGKRERILTAAVRLFSEKGFHGAAMRDIAAEAGCSLPMLYYYYENKEKLFYAIAYNEFVALIERLNSEAKRSSSLVETYTYAVIQRKKLNEYDKAVYKLAQRAWLGFEGDSGLRDDLIKWERGRQERTKMAILLKYEPSASLELFAHTLVRLMENMIEKIIFFDEEIPDEQIRKEIHYLASACEI